jgi:hypothetical protein
MVTARDAIYLRQSADSFTKLEPFGARLPTTLLVIQCFCKWHSACYLLRMGQADALDSIQTFAVAPEERCQTVQSFR